MIDRGEHAEREQRDRKRDEVRRERRRGAAHAAADVEHHHHVAAAPAVGEPARRQREDAEGEERRGAERQQFAVGAAVDPFEADHHGREDQHHVMIDGMREVVEPDRQPPAGFVIQGSCARNVMGTWNLGCSPQHISRRAPASYADFEDLTAIPRPLSCQAAARLRFSELSGTAAIELDFTTRARIVLPSDRRCRRRSRGPGGLPMRRGMRRRVLRGRSGDRQRGGRRIGRERSAPTPTRTPRFSQLLHGPHPVPAARSRRAFLLFSSTDLWRHGGFAHGGLLWAPAGLDRQGPVLSSCSAAASIAIAPARSPTPRCAATCSPLRSCPAGASSATVSPSPCSWESIFNGHRLTPDDLSAGLRGDYARRPHRFRPLGSAQRAATMFSADASFSTVGPELRRAPCDRVCARSIGSISARRSRPSAPATTTGNSAPACTSPGFGRAHSNGRRAPAGPPTAIDRSGPYGKLGLLTRR